LLGARAVAREIRTDISNKWCNTPSHDELDRLE
jgi:hypothetical protein